LRYSDLLQQQQQQQQQQDEIVSLPERFGRLFSGQFIREREARSKGLAADAPGQQQQQGDTQFAAMQFEVLKRLQQQQQQQPAEGASTPATAAAAAAAAAAVTVGADGIMDVLVEPQPAAAAADTTSQTTPPPAAAAATNEAFYPASTTVLVLCSWAVFGLQWVQALPDLWGVVTGRLLDAAAGLLLAFPDAPATRGMMLVSTRILDLSSVVGGPGMEGGVGRDGGWAGRGKNGEGRNSLIYRLWGRGRAGQGRVRKHVHEVGMEVLTPALVSAHGFCWPVHLHVGHMFGRQGHDMTHTGCTFCVNTVQSRVTSCC
jgi:hypothetical protein